jgi:adenylate cyclase
VSIKAHQFSVKHWPLAIKLGVFFTLPLVVALSFLGWWQQRSFEELIETQTNTFGNTLATQVSESVAELVLAEDLLALEVMLSGILRQSPIQYAGVFSYEDQLLTETRAEEAIGPLQMDPSLTQFSAPIYYQDVRVGRLVIDIDVSILSDALRRSKSQFFNTHYWVLLAALTLTFLLARYFTRPLRWLRESSAQIAKGEWPELIEYDAKDEIGHLIQSFNKMTTELREKERIKQTFYKFVSQPVADNLLTEDLKQSEAIYNYSRSSIIFIDLVGFTALCERSAPREVASLLNDYYQIIYYASHKFSGHVDKFIGDGAMIVFGVLSEDSSHALHSVLCADLMRKLIEALNAERKLRDLDILGIRVGIDTGEVLAGSLGADERAQYTVVGDVVNMASRLCDASEPNEILVGDMSVQELGVEGMLVFDGPRYLQVKGRTDPMAVYSVSGLTKAAELLIKHHAQGWQYDASPEADDDDWL